MSSFIKNNRTVEVLIGKAAANFILITKLCFIN